MTEVDLPKPPSGTIRASAARMLSRWEGWRVELSVDEAGHLVTRLVREDGSQAFQVDETELPDLAEAVADWPPEALARIRGSRGPTGDERGQAGGGEGTGSGSGDEGGGMRPPPAGGDGPGASA